MKTNGMTKPTMRDIAKMSGVSVAAVSMALNDKPGVSAATRERIFAIVKEMSYDPLQNDPQLKKVRQRQIRVITPHDLDVLLQIPYYLIALAGVKRACIAAKYDMLLTTEDEWLARKMPAEHRNIDLASGILLMGTNKHTKACIARARDWDMPAAIINRQVGIPDVLTVREKKAEAITAAVAHLKKIGRSRVGFFDCTPLFERHYPVFKTACENYGLETCDGAIRWEKASYVPGNLDALQAAGDMPDAFLAFNDRHAVVTIKNLQRLGYRVPEDIVVIGYDDEPLAQYATPELTTIHSPIDEMAEYAVGQLIRMADGANDMEMEKLFDAPLVFRQSCPESV